MQAGTAPRGQGRVMFAATLFLVLGTFNVIDGLVALFNDSHFVADELFFGDLTFWGILLLIVGGVQLLTGNLIFKKSANGQALGIALCCLNLVMQLFFLPVYPVWSLLIMALDVMIIYALCIYDEHFV